jgi:hypothetical protein
MKIDPKRETNYADFSGVYVRAQNASGQWVNADIAQLDYESVLSFLKRDPEFAQGIALTLLGYTVI